MDLLTADHRAALNAASESELRELNAYLVSIMRDRSTVKQMAAGRAFQPGDRATFFSNRRARNVVIVIERINQKSVSGHEVGDSMYNGTKWKVTPSMLSACAR